MTPSSQELESPGIPGRFNRLNALALDWQKQACAVIAQWLGAIWMINRFCQQCDILIKPLLASHLRCLIVFHRLISTNLT